MSVPGRGIGAFDEAERLLREPAGERPGSTGTRTLMLVAAAFVLLAAVSELTDSPQLTAAGAWGATLRLMVPIMLAGLGGLWAERSGVANIGLEGMMILGTWFGAWAGVEFGPEWGVVAGVLGGALGGLLHAVATVSFGVNQIVSGVAINILAFGSARFLSVLFFTGAGGGATQSPQVEGRVGVFTLPFVSGGELFGWKTPDLLGLIGCDSVRQCPGPDSPDIFLITDLAALIRGVTDNVSILTLIALAMVPLTFVILWKTAFGLRLRSVGEHPVAAESLGVRVYTMKYVAVTVSGALAGFGGSYLVLEAARIYREGQTGGRGFIGLAAMIAGNWRPMGTAGASGLFGYASALELRSEAAVHGLLLFVAIVLVVAAVWVAVRKRRAAAPVVLLVFSGLFFWWWSVTDTVPRQITVFLPHITTLLVMSFATARLRAPVAAGLPYRRGQQT